MLILEVYVDSSLTVATMKPRPPRDFTVALNQAPGRNELIEREGQLYRVLECVHVNGSANTGPILFVFPFTW